MPLSLKAIIGGGSSPVGSYLTGKLAADTNYLRCNAARYLLSAYPDVNNLVSSGQLVTNYEMSESYLNMIDVPRYNQYISVGWVADGNRILFASRNGFDDTHLISRSDDNGVTWTKVVQKTTLAVGLGLSQSTTLVLHDIIKVGTDTYAAIVSDIAANPAFFTIRTSDAFNTVSVIGQSKGTGPSAQFSSGDNYRGRFIPGPSSNQFIAIVPLNTGVHAFYLTADGGQTYSFISKNGATWDSGNLFNAQCDGTNLFYVNSTTLYHTPWPANGTVPAFTTVSSKFSVSVDKIKKFANRYVAWSSTGNIQTSTTLTGTYTASSWTGIQTINDIEEVGSKWFVLAYITASGRYSLLHTTDAVSPATPLERSFVSPALCSDLPVGQEYFKFQRRYGAATSAIQFVHGIMDIVSTTNGTTFTSIYRHKPRTNYGLVKKYGYYFASGELAYATFGASAITNFSVAGSQQQRCLYRSTNLQDWEPIMLVRSDVMDLGSRLYVLISGGTNVVIGRQTTDGVTWNTTGITEPSKPTLHQFVKVHVCNGILYHYVMDSSNNSASYNASTNQGLSWSSVSPLHIDWLGGVNNGFIAPSYEYFGCMAFYKGRYFHVTSAFDGTNGFWRYRLGVSTDGLTWTFPLATSGNWTNLTGQTQGNRQRGPLAVVLNNSLYICVGTDSSGGYINMIKSDDGITFAVHMSSHPDAFSPLVSNASNYATENGPDVYFVLRSSSPYAIYKNGVALDRVTVGQTTAPGINALDEINDVYTMSHAAITRHPKANVTFTTPNITTPTETFMRVKR